MVKVDESFELRYKSGKHHFQVLIDFEKYQEFKKNPDNIQVYDVLADTKIYSDQKKGEIASEHILKEIFPDKDEDAILKEILLKGECQIPTAYTNKLRQEKKEQVKQYIVENTVNPVMKSKFTPSMIENALAKIHYNFDPNKSTQIQAEEVITLLKKHLSISTSKVILEISVPPLYTKHFYGPFRAFGKMLIEKYDAHGNLNMRLEIVEGMKDKVIEFIKSKTGNSASYHLSAK